MKSVTRTHRIPLKMMQILCFSLVLISLVALCSTGKIEVQNCSGIINKVSNVEVEVSDCPDGNNCTLYRGRTYYLTTTFTPNENFSVVKVRTLGVMGILKVPYIGPRLVCPEVTTQDGGNCDSEVGLVAGRTYMHVNEFPVRRMYPEISIKARVEYRRHSRFLARTFLCYEIPVKIESPPEDESDTVGT